MSYFIKEKIEKLKEDWGQRIMDWVLWGDKPIESERSRKWRYSVNKNPNDFNENE